MVTLRQLLGALGAALLGAAVAEAKIPDHSAATRLAHEATWLKLGHYERADAEGTRWRSAIHSAEFFLAPDGATNPTSELEATLREFAAAGPVDDSHALCRFPARRLWLKSKLKDHPALSRMVSCPGFSAWTRQGRISSVSVVFATGYLGNPASYFGHTLLKFNIAGDSNATPLLDLSVNYGAIVGPGVDPLSYIVRGVTGGYDGGFSHIQFYYHNHNYGDIELRDLWEYRLDLPQPAVDLIVAHAWELLGKRFTYYFFKLNCVYRMGALLQVVDGLDVIPDDLPWLIPQALIHKLSEARLEGRRVLAGVIYLPSRQTRFYQKYRNLTAQQVTALESIGRGEQDLNGSALGSLDLDGRQRVLDALIDYYQFVAAPIDKASLTVRQAYAATLAARLRLPPGTPTSRHAEPRPPHLGRAPGWLQSGWEYQPGSGGAVSVRYRPAYYDPLDSDDGHVPFSGLAMGDLSLRITSQRVVVRRFDLFAVESANPGLTRLPGDNVSAMKVRLGAEQLRLSCEPCLAPRLQGDIGYGRQWVPGVYGALYAGGALQVDRAGQGAGFGRVSADLIVARSDVVRARVTHEIRFPLSSGLERYHVSRGELRWRIGARSDLRLSLERDQQRRVQVAHGIYF